MTTHHITRYDRTLSTVIHNKCVHPHIIYSVFYKNNRCYIFKKIEMPSEEIKERKQKLLKRNKIKSNPTFPILLW